MNLLLWLWNTNTFALLIEQPLKIEFDIVFMALLEDKLLTAELLDGLVVLSCRVPSAVKP